ncbi:hypothetical protein ACGFMM_29800 [Streptomyces sp. NPDC048604]|uniref:hypothetical protein n=1 Tax=Streptomyces sp. NPDC048604 TaxID=3365578 RepID=UPI0037106EEF
MAEQQDGGEREPQPIDEEAAWAAIVAGYGEEPADPPGAKPFRPVEDLALPAYEEPAVADADGDGSAADGAASRDGDVAASGDGDGDGAASGDGSADDDGSGDEADDEDDDRGDVRNDDGDEDREAAGPAKPPLGSSIVFAPGVSPGAGPRDYALADPDDEPEPATRKKGGDDDEGHFVPPEPPPLPEADATTKFAWLGAIGGPVLMLLAVLFQWEMTWWLTTVCVVGFLGGFATLVARMKHDDDDDDHDDPGRGAVV